MIEQIEGRKLHTNDFQRSAYKDSRKPEGVSYRPCSVELFNNHPNLTYSKSENAVYYLPCALFPPSGHNTPQNLVTRGYSNCKKINQVVQEHMKDLTGTHEQNCERMRSFLGVMRGERRSISQQLDKQYDKEVQSNKKTLKNILETSSLRTSGYSYSWSS